MIENSNRIINNLEKLERKRKQIPKSIDRILIEKGQEVIDKSICDLVPSKNVVELDYIVDEISNKTKIKTDIVVNAILNANPKTLIITEVGKHIFLKRNTI